MAGTRHNGEMDNVTLQERFRENVVRLLSERGFTRSDLTREMGVGPAYVTDYLNGRFSQGLEVLARFSSALAIDPSELLMEPSHAH